MKTLKDTPLSRIWLYGGYLYKWQPKFLTENEIYCLECMAPTGFVPAAERVEMEIIRMEHITEEPITRPGMLLYYADWVLFELNEKGIRHGDLTRPNILIRNDKPILLDFAESRLTCDPRPDKRPEGDKYWLKRTIQEILNGA